MKTRKSPKNTENLVPTLTPLQLKAIDLILAGGKYTEIARSLDICYDRLWRWSRNPVFKGEIDRRKRITIEASQNALINAATQAVETLVAGLQSADENTRIKCSMAILSRLPAIESIPVTDWESEMRERAELLAETEDASNDLATLELIDSLEVFKDLEKADQWHKKLMEKAISDLRS
jgi:hypothetical protein